VSVIENYLVHLAESAIRFYGYDGLLKLLGRSPKVDERIAKLAQIEQDLKAAIEAVHDLHKSALQSKAEAQQLQEAVAQLQQDKVVAEELVKAPEEAFGRMLQRANARGRGRGLIEGVTIGLVTGFASSILAWYVTK